METCLTQGGRDAADNLLMLENGPYKKEHEIEIPPEFRLDTYEAFTSKF